MAAGIWTADTLASATWAAEARLTIVTRGYGNGTYNGTIGLVVKRGFAQTLASDVWAEVDSAADAWAAS